ncbi:hypothetical protein FNV43_RR25165 [Rhamnella rubrinervis]|uniref:Shugoshin C-terminal domain-containing protein n=1 Tax=Rhamnella rubrinervis TaxID=2594499 RepID=A0A8K0DZH6_9ROSA|nr:hypothetical protein FNV43_RR25165 [Rhamnella rubrinervis]
MDNATLLGSENFGVGGSKKGEKILKGTPIGAATRKKLADISNMQNQQPNPANQDTKQQATKLATKEYVDKLHKEIMTLMQLLTDRNKLLELSRIEILKLRTNLEKLQQQNLQLAQANSQMQGELNSCKDRLLVIQHELGCKNVFLKAMKLEAEEKAKTVTCQNAGNEEVSINYEEAREPSKPDRVNKPDNANRRRQSKKQSLVPPTAKANHAKEIQDKETVDNEKRRSRRLSARAKSEESEPNKDSLEIDDAKLTVSPIHDDSLHDNHPKEIHAKKTVDKKRRCSRRFYASPKSEEPEPNEDPLELDDAKFTVSLIHDDSVHDNRPSQGSSVKEEDGGKTAPIPDAQEFRRSSVGRPLRRAAEKVQSYKEGPINVKMRRLA